MHEREAAIAGAAAKDTRPGTGSLSTLFTGIIFGLQPDALFVIVPALALPTKLAALAYILMFVFGTVAAMGSYTAFIGAHAGMSEWRREWREGKERIA
jgi:hypothetical protein